MSERPRSRLPVPVGSVLEGGVARTREDRLWAQIRARRASGLGGHSEPPKAGMVLPSPLARLLDDGDDLTNRRSRLWRQIQSRRHVPRGAACRRPPIPNERATYGKRSAFALGFALAACALLLLLWPRADHTQPLQLASRPRALSEQSGRALTSWQAHGQRRVIALGDGSEIRLEPGAHVQTSLASADRVELRLDRGAAEFSVTPGGPRRWLVDAGLAKVEVLGTVFRVARTEAAVQVSVSRGTVLVRSAQLSGGSQRLTRGHSLQVVAPSARLATQPQEVAPPAPVVDTPARQETGEDIVIDDNGVRSAAAARSRRSRSASHVGWKALVKQGRYAEAYAALGPAGIASEARTTGSVEALLWLADTARLSGHPAQAVLPLQRVLRDFSHGPHAGLAAFTLGRVLLDQLHEPDKAASAFEQAIALHPPHALLADCHARLVESYARAGNADAAQRAATRYRTLFPSGGHNLSVPAVTRSGP